MFVAGKFINIFSVRNGFGVLRYYAAHARINLLFVMLVFFPVTGTYIPVRVVLIRSVFKSVVI
jgi:hypothetical protein